jgi:acetolactate synthase-1/2/3 large subunit
MPTHSEIVARTLADCGVEYIFGLPGGEILALMDACRRAGLRFLLAGHETSAACMAQVMGQLREIPGVCVATLGPGATNLVTGVANAFLDRAPLLAFTAQIPAAIYRTMSHQRLALSDLFATITKRSVTIGDGNTVEVILRSMKLASAPRPGPVHLILPSDVASAECSAESFAEGAAASLTGWEGPLTQIAARIDASKRPLVLVGLGARPWMAPALRSFVGQLQAPFLVTPKVKGILPEDDPHFLGVASGMAIDRVIVETIRTADVVIAIGFDPVECDKTWFAEAEIVSLDSVGMSEGDYHPLEAVGDIPSQLSALVAVVNPKPWPEELISDRRRATLRSPTGSQRGLSPLRLIEKLRAVFPRAGIVTCDVGSHKLLMGQFWRSFEPGTFLVSNGLSGMSFGVPAAIAAQLSYRDRSVMAVVGDGGMLMMVHDLVLIRELNLPVVIVVFSDSSLSLIRVSQKRRGLPDQGVDFAAPDFAAVAQAFGVRGIRAASMDAVCMALDHALTTRSPLVLDVPVDMQEYYDLV